MRRCRKCGKENDDSTRYCEECGAELVSLSTGYQGKGLEHVQVESNPLKDVLTCFSCIMFIVLLAVGWFLLTVFFGEILYIIIGIIMIIFAIGFLVYIVLALMAWKKDVKQSRERKRKKAAGQN